MAALPREMGCYQFVLAELLSVRHCAVCSILTNEIVSGLLGVHGPKTCHLKTGIQLESIQQDIWHRSLSVCWKYITPR